MNEFNSLMRVLGRIPEKPRHLSVYRKSVRPIMDAVKEELVFEAEGDNGIIEFFVDAIVNDRNVYSMAEIIIKDNKNDPSSHDNLLFIIDPSKIIDSIEGHFAPKRRKLDSHGQLSLVAWAALRVGEYISDRFKIDHVTVSGDGVYALAAEYASRECGGNMIYQGDSYQIDEDLIKESPRLFSLGFVKSSKNT